MNRNEAIGISPFQAAGSLQGSSFPVVGRTPPGVGAASRIGCQWPRCRVCCRTGLTHGAETPRRTHARPSSANKTTPIHTRQAERAIPLAVSPEPTVRHCPMNKTG